MKKGLLTPYVMVSIAGLVEELDNFSGYSQLQDICKEHGVEIHSSMMSMTGAINMGKGTVTVGFASQGEELAF
ncbi:hypothetical protein ACH42_04105 [Endozoicomonas sp. (ex Bugula neritina AB1)]|nr:hypothetical protein ACH42_04105 [Endozoicomonas sp. (ex Bugula neritina AB1)]